MTTKYSFEKSLRLLNKNDFQNLKSGSRFFISDILIFYVKPNFLNVDRLGVAITKKYGNAVKRNKVKRLLREAFRLEKERFSSLDILASVNLKKIKSSKIDYDCVEKKIKNSMKIAYSKQFIG